MLDWFAVVVALLALSVSLVQWWRTELAPYSVVIIPPAVTQANDELPSLILDVALTNLGGKAALLSDVAIRLLSDGNDNGVVLHAQKCLNREATYGALPLEADKTTAAVFLPVLVRRNETVALRLYCAPFVSELPLKEAAILATNGIAIDVWIDGALKPNVYVLGYPDYKEKFPGGGALVIPKTGFTPRWFRALPPVAING